MSVGQITVYLCVKLKIVMMLVCRIIVVVLLLVEGISGGVHKRTKRIVDRSFVEENEFSAVVGLVRKKENYYYVSCGGSIIHKKIVLTAAHCVHEKDPDKILVLYGSNNLNHSKIFETEAILVHWWYHSDPTMGAVNDIALILIRGTFPHHIDPMTLPERPGLSDAYLRCEIPGWGLEKYPDSTTGEDLRQLALVKSGDEFRVICHRNCIQKKRNVETAIVAECLEEEEKDYEVYLEDRHLCTFGISGVTCFGDTGSPVICSGIQYGIVDFGPCENYSSSFIHSIETRVGFYNEWIINAKEYLLSPDTKPNINNDKKISEINIPIFSALIEYIYELLGW